MNIESKNIEAVIDALYAEHEHYSKYRIAIDESELKNAEATDKAVLTISSASLGLILALTKDIDLKGLDYTLYLAIGWLTILSAMGFVLGSMFISGLLHAKHRNQIDQILLNRGEIIADLQQADSEEEAIQVTDKQGFIPHKNLNIINRGLHYLAPVLLITGVVLIGIFFKSHVIDGVTSDAGHRKANSNTATATTAKETNKAICSEGAIKTMSEERQNASVPPPNPMPKAPPQPKQG